MVSVRFQDPVVWRYIGRRGKILLLRFPRARLQAPFERNFDRGVVKKVSLTQQGYAAELEMELTEGAGKEGISYDSASGELRVVVGSGRESVEEAAPVRESFSPFLVSNSPRSKRHGTIRRIMVDPGHGGRDVGALGRSGLEEKDVALLLARSLANYLRVRGGYEVALTRNEDVFVPLAGRTNMANQWKADLFISVHCNSSLSHRLRGFEVYFMSEKASDAEAEAVARTENSVLAFEQEGSMDSKVRRLLLSMAKNEYLNEASRLCAYIAQKVQSEIGREKPRVRQANFHVLREAGMPAVLVEFDYLSNPVSEARLRSSRHREKLAASVARGIMSYDSSLSRTSRRGAF